MTKIESLWRDAAEQVRKQPIDNEGFRLIRVDPDTPFDIYAGIDASMFVLLAIGVRERPPNIAVDSSSLDYFRQQRHDGSWLMVLRLRQHGLEAVFGRLCQDLLDAASQVESEKLLIALFKDRLNLWKRLFQQGGSGLLQLHQIKGLIAELLVLESLIESEGRDMLETISGWTGPLGADQDFLFSDSAVEVKAIGPATDDVSISSLQQLDCAVPLRLTVHMLRPATPGEHGSMGLNSLVARIEGSIAASPVALTLFKERLLEACYVENDFYDTVLFESISHSSYVVGEGFPKLTGSMVPAGIVRATYSIALKAIDSFKVSEGAGHE